MYTIILVSYAREAASNQLRLVCGDVGCSTSADRPKLVTRPNLSYRY